jgi:hypothetical protein
VLLQLCTAFTKLEVCLKNINKSGRHTDIEKNLQHLYAKLDAKVKLNGLLPVNNNATVAAEVTRDLAVT